ncbi:MAG: GtrA family protein [Halochromatium sp.]|nr:GtrA family protein [Halochromatium sp.]
MQPHPRWLERAHRLLESGPLSGLTGEVLRFGVVGSAGFMTDATLLMLLVGGLDWNPYLARLLSFLCGTVITWLLNRLFTFFRRAGVNRRREYLRYLMVQAVGGAINLGIYSLVLSILPPMALVPLVAMAAGSFTAMWLNFFGARQLAFDRDGSAALAKSSAD